MKVTALERSATGIEGYRIENDRGIFVEVITFGARIHKLTVPDRNGRPVDVVAGFNDFDGYRGDNPYFNAVIGRVANRIGGAAFTLNGKRYDLYKNDGENHLHGGKSGFDQKIWKAEVISGSAVKFSYLSPSGEENYPGNLYVEVIYSLDNEGALNIDYRAKSDEDTLVSLTNHAYFNLSGEFDTILDHEVFISSDAMTDIDGRLIPTGKIVPLDNTPHDFSLPKGIGKDINACDKYLKIAGGYDFNFVLRGGNPAARAYCERSGIIMEVLTDRPCMQLYTGNFLDGLKGKKTYGRHSAFCMETQGYPNACNIETFPSITLKAGEEYKAKTSYVFGVIS